MMKAAFDLSERYHTPVIVRPTTRINHASTFFEVAEETHGRPLPEGGFQKDPKWVIFPKRAYEGHGEINRRLAQIAWDYAHDPHLRSSTKCSKGAGKVRRLASCRMASKVLERPLLRWALWLAAYRQPTPARRYRLLRPRPPAPEFLCPATVSWP